MKGLHSIFGFVSVTEEQTLKLYLILINLNFSCHMWLVAITLDTAALHNLFFSVSKILWFQNSLILLLTGL